MSERPPADPQIDPASPPPPHPVPPLQAQAQPPAPQVVTKTRTGWAMRIFLMFLLGILSLSILMNLSALSMGILRDGQPPLQTTTLHSGDSEQTVAVFKVNGVIDDQAVQRFERFYHSVIDNPRVKAVVVRVESPGGGLTASDQIHRMVLGLKETDRPVVISMGAMATSGGYFISAPADQIFAERTTMTGSIGVVASWLVLEGTMDKLGIEPMVVKSTNARGWKDQLSPFRQPKDYEMDHLIAILDNAQKQFEQVVREGRTGLKPKTVTFEIPNPSTEPGAPKTVSHTETEPFNGKIYGARDALALGLIDEIGYREDAINRAASLAGLDNPHVVRYHRRAGLFGAMMQGQTNRASLGIDAESLRDLQTPKIELIWKMQ